MGKESGLIEAARTGNLQVISSYITKAKAGSTRTSKSHRKISFFTLHNRQSQRRRSSGMNRSSGGLDCSDLNGETPLHLAALNNHKAAVILLMNGGAKMNIRDNQGCLPLHLAAWTGNVDICRVLLHGQLNTEVNAQNKAGDTALHIASQYGHTAVVRLLLQHEANPMIRNIRGESSLDLSAFYGRLETVSLLINDQPALMQQIQHSHSPLHLAARNGQKDVVRKLLQTGYNINAKTMSGSALHEAATYGKVTVVKLLIQSGIDKAIRDSKNQTAEEMLASHNSAVSNSLLSVIRGEENLYHSLSGPEPTVSTSSTSRHKYCKHGKLIKDESHQRRTRERSSSGQTSGSSSSPPTSPTTVLLTSTYEGEQPSSKHHRKQSDQRLDCRSSELASPAVTATSPHQSSSHGYIKDHHLSQCCHGYQMPSVDTRRCQHASNDVQYKPYRHTSGPSRVHHSNKGARSYSSSAVPIQQEKSRHKSASVISNDVASSDYIKLSDTISYPVGGTADDHVYNAMLETTSDHCYNTMDSSQSDIPIYDHVPKPVALPSDSATSRLDFNPLSPSFTSSVNHSSTDDFSAESQDSVYNSSSLSPEFNGLHGRRYLGHIYVNLSTYRSTPDLNKLTGLEAPRKPPRTETPNPDASGLCKSSDYVCVDMDSMHLSQSQDLLSSDSSFGDKIPLSVPPGGSNFGQMFVFPPVAPLAKPEFDDEDNDNHEYENVGEVIESPKPKSPPKAMPRKSKSKLASFSPTSNNNNGESSTKAEHMNWSYSTDSSIVDVEEKDCEPNNQLHSIEVDNHIVCRPSSNGMSLDGLEDDNYEEWKQIDGFFASMGLDGELTEESINRFLKKDKISKCTSIGDWLESFGLGIYENVLVANGFDNVDLLNGVLEVTDLHLMDFTNIEHIDKILDEISKLPSISPIDVNRPPAAVSEWLSSLALDDYIEQFYMLEYGTMPRVLQIWEIELATVLSVVLLGHQKRILASLGHSRPGFNTMRRKQRANISDISQVVKIRDIKVDSPPHDFFKDTFSRRQFKESDENLSELSQSLKSPAGSSLADSDSGCSIASDNIKLDTAEEMTSNSSSYTLSIPSMLPKTTSLDQRSTPPIGNSSTSSGTKASYDRSQSAKHITKTVNEAQSKLHHPRPGVSQTVNQRALTASTSDSDHSDTADYANLSDTGVPLIGNVEGLKLSHARDSVIQKNAKRPLPELPNETTPSFTTKDLPQNFKGKHNPQILIEGCVNYSACYLGTCLVHDTSRPGSTREAIARMKTATRNLAKLPIVTLSISFKGVNFIDASTQRAICEHEITNIYCAAQDSSSMNYFAYITNDVLTRGLYCHVFCVKSEELARQAIMTLGEAFDIAFYAIQKHPSLLDPDT